MPKPSKPKKEEQVNVQAENNSIAIGKIEIGGDLSGVLNIGGTVNIQEAVKSAYGLFTIPAPVKDFTGRTDELEKLKTSFKDGAIITGVSGGGGVGKTELARRLAQEIAEDYPDARMSIDLLGTSETALAPEEAMRRLLEPLYPNQKLPDEPAQLKGLYQQTFAAQKILILLDNAKDENQVRPLIPPKPSAAIITSRKYFSLTEFGLAPLRLDVLSPEDARDLLRKASQKLKKSPDADLDALAKLCGLLPLALRVAASLLNDRLDWKLSTLQKRLEDERTRLKHLKREGDLDLDVEATLSLSYNLLDGNLKQKFRLLGVFIAPFVRLSAQAVWKLEDEAEADNLLGKFTNLSLLSLSTSTTFRVGGREANPVESSGGEGIHQYSIHDLTRLFATDRLLESEEEAKSSLMLHANHFLDWARYADSLYQKGNEEIFQGLAQFRFIWTHLKSAHDRLLPENKYFPHPAEADDWLNEFPNKCANVLDLHLPPRQKIPLIEAALKAARRLDKRQVEGVHLSNLANIYISLNDGRKAIEILEQRVAIAHETGDKRINGETLNSIGNAYGTLREPRKAIEYYERALHLIMETGNKHAEGPILANLGSMYVFLGNPRYGLELFEKALIVNREIGDKRNEGVALGNLGLVYAILGDSQASINYLKQALSIAQDIGDRLNEGKWLGSLGLTYVKMGETRFAIEFFEKQLVIMHEFGNRSAEAHALVSIGMAFKDLGENAKAHSALETALQIYQAIESPQAKTVKDLLANLDGDKQEQVMPLEDFIHMVFQVSRNKLPLAEQLFGNLSKMAVDSNQPSEIQSLAKVLRDVIAGIKDPDLSKLPEEFAKIVLEELEKKE